MFFFYKFYKKIILILLFQLIYLNFELVFLNEIKINIKINYKKNIKMSDNEIISSIEKKSSKENIDEL